MSNGHIRQEDWRRTGEKRKRRGPEKKNNKQSFCKKKLKITMAQKGKGGTKYRKNLNKHPRR